MSRFQHTTAAVLLAAMLAGCGSQGVNAVAGVPIGSRMSAASAAAPTDARVTALVDRYRAIGGDGASAMNERAAIVGQLATTNSDQAASFLMGEYDHAKALPEATRAQHQQVILSALSNLDAYDPVTDGAIIKAGPGSTPEQASQYAEAMAKKGRHNSFLRWITQPLHWADAAIRWIYKTVNGESGHKGGKGGGGSGPAPAPAPPAPAPGPAGPGGGPAPAGP